ncbi:hypothetical protein VTI74DRAFT_11455 [Chaetomium olivicolor]
MEADLQTLSKPLHAYAGPTVLPSSAADAVTRPSKKRRPNLAFDRTEELRTALPVIDSVPVFSQGEAGTPYAVSVFPTNTDGSITIDDIATWSAAELGTPGRSLCPPRSRCVVPAIDTSSFQQAPPWAGPTVKEGNQPPNTFYFEAEPPPWPGTFTETPAQMSWGPITPSPVDQMTPGYLPYHWPTASGFPPAAGGQNTYDQSPATTAFSPWTPVPASPSQPAIAGFPLIPIETNCLQVVQSGYGQEVVTHQSSYQSSIQEFRKPRALGDATAPSFNRFGGLCIPNPVLLDDYHSPASLRQSVSSDDSVEQGPIFNLTQPHVGNAKQSENGNWIKREHQEELERSRQEPTTYPSVPVTEGPPRPGDDMNREGSRDRKRRARFDEYLRKETSNTRTMGACLRCHNQRVRCIPNKQDANSPIAPCETCLRVRRDSKKTIHFIPCLRFKVTSMVANRPGGLGYTKRFDHTKVVNVTDYVDNLIYDIEMTQGLCRPPVRLRVRRFKPNDTDVSHRWYLDSGTLKKQDLGAFCLVDVERTARDFNEYIARNALEGLSEAVKGSDDIVKDTLAMIVRHCSSLPDTVKLEGGHTTKEAKRKSLRDQKDFLQKIVRLWFAVRHGTGSAYLCGKEYLGMTPAKGFVRPYIPRMIVAQFDSIRNERIWKRLAPEVLRAFDTLLTSCNKEAWFTVFLATFLLLYQVACTSQDRYRHVRQNFEGKSQDTRYGPLNHPLTAFVEDVHHGAVMLLAHWQYFKRCDLMNFHWENTEDTALAHLEPYQVEFLRRIVGRLREKLGAIPKTPAEGCWEHELFWVSKMFASDPSRKTDWSPPESFTRAKPSVGRE